MRVALIGFGAIGQALVAHLRDLKQGIDIVGALVRSDNLSAPDMRCFSDLEALFDSDPDLIVECAGHAAMPTHVLRALSAGREVLAVSLGALADVELEDALRATAGKSGGKLFLSCGALPGVDALSALHVGGLSSVAYRGSKPPAAWGEHAERYAKDLETSRTPIVLCAGTAREIALQFPKNANVVGAVALAGLGWDQTQAKLLIDPSASRNEHYVQAESASGALELRVSSIPSAQNARTSAITAQTLANEIVRRVRPVTL